MERQNPMYILIAYLLGILTAVKRIDPVNKTNQTQNESNESLPIVGAIAVHVPPEIEAKKEAKDDKKRRLDYLMALIHTITMLAVVWYAYINSHMLNKMTEANQVARDAIRLQQRPWVGIDDSLDALQISPIHFDKEGNASLSYAIKVKDFSNNAAQNVNVSFGLMVTSELAKVIARRDELCSVSVTNTDFGLVIFPGSQRITTKSSTRFPRSEMVDNKSYVPKFQAFLVGCIGYRDSTGHLYHSGYIYWPTDPETGLAVGFDVVPNGEFVVQHWGLWKAFID